MIELYVLATSVEISNHLNIFSINLRLHAVADCVVSLYSVLVPEKVMLAYHLDIREIFRRYDFLFIIGDSLF